MKLLSFFYKGKVYAILITSEEVKLYTNKDTLMFNHVYEAVDWLKYR